MVLPFADQECAEADTKGGNSLERSGVSVHYAPVGKLSCYSDDTTGR